MTKRAVFSSFATGPGLRTRFREGVREKNVSLSMKCGPIFFNHADLSRMILIYYLTFAYCLEESGPLIYLDHLEKLSLISKVLKFFVSYF